MRDGKNQGEEGVENLSRRGVVSAWTVRTIAWVWVCLPEAELLDRLCIVSSYITQTHLRKEKREYIVLCPLTRGKRLLFSVFTVRCRPESWGEWGRYLDVYKLVPIGGHTRISVNKRPCQPEMQRLASYERHSTARMWCVTVPSGPLSAIWRKISRKIKSEDNPIKASRPSLTPEQVLLYPCHYLRAPGAHPFADSTDSQLEVSQWADRAAVVW